MRLVRIHCALSIAFGVIASARVAVARDLYVATNGDDAAAGSLAAPWKTLAKAASQAQAGDTVHIRAGTYAERLSPAHSGTAAAQILFTAYTGEHVTLNGTGLSGQGMIYISGVKYVTVSGIEVTNAPEAGIWVINSSYVTLSKNRTYNTVSSGIIVSELGTNDHITIDGNDVELCNNDGPQECVSISHCDTFQVTNNTIHDGGPGTNGGEGIDTKFGSANGVVAHNHVYNLKRQGLYADAWSVATHDIEFYGNIVHDCSFGIGVASEQGGALSNVGFHDNLVYDTTGPGMYILVSAGPLQKISFVNNTVDHTGTGWGSGMWFNGPDAQGVVVRNNVFSNLSGEPFLVQAAPADWTLDHNLAQRAQSGNVPGFIIGTPAYADAAAKDFHLTAKSPAVDTGNPTTVFPTTHGDVEGAPRVRDGNCDGKAVIDLGAYEFDGKCPGEGGTSSGGSSGTSSGGTGASAGATSGSGGTTSGSGGRTSGSGGTTSNSGSNTGAAAGTASADNARASSGCGCHTPGNGRAPSSWLPLASLVIAAARRKR